MIPEAWSGGPPWGRYPPQRGPPWARRVVAPRGPAPGPHPSTKTKKLQLDLLRHCNLRSQKTTSNMSLTDRAEQDFLGSELRDLNVRAVTRQGHVQGATSFRRQLPKEVPGTFRRRPCRGFDGPGLFRGSFLVTRVLLGRPKFAHTSLRFPKNLEPKLEMGLGS